MIACGTCKHFDYTPSEGEHAGYCLLLPPVVVAIDAPQEDGSTRREVVSTVPSTNAHARCGQHTPPVPIGGLRVHTDA